MNALNNLSIIGGQSIRKRIDEDSGSFYFFNGLGYLNSNISCHFLFLIV